MALLAAVVLVELMVCNSQFPSFLILILSQSISTKYITLLQRDLLMKAMAVILVRRIFDSLIDCCLLQPFHFPAIQPAFAPTITIARRALEFRCRSDRYPRTTGRANPRCCGSRAQTPFQSRSDIPCK